MKEMPHSESSWFNPNKIWGVVLSVGAIILIILLGLGSLAFLLGQAIAVAVK